MPLTLNAKNRRRIFYAIAEILFRLASNFSLRAESFVKKYHNKMYERAPTCAGRRTLTPSIITTLVIEKAFSSLAPHARLLCFVSTFESLRTKRRMKKCLFRFEILSLKIETE